MVGNARPMCSGTQYHTCTKFSCSTGQKSHQKEDCACMHWCDVGTGMVDGVTWSFRRVRMCGRWHARYDAGAHVHAQVHARIAYTHHGCRDTAVATFFRLAAEHNVASKPSAVTTHQRRRAAAGASPAQHVHVCVSRQEEGHANTPAHRTDISKVLVGTRRLVRGSYTTRLSTVRASVRRSERATGRHSLSSAATRATRWCGAGKGGRSVCVCCRGTVLGAHCTEPEWVGADARRNNYDMPLNAHPLRAPPKARQRHDCLASRQFRVSPQADRCQCTCTRELHT